MDSIGKRYEVLRTISEGPRATVLQALDRQLEKSVALKVYPVTSDTDREALLAEVRVLLSITPHPALPVARNDFFDGNRYVVVLDWVDGVDLAQVLDDEGGLGLPLSEVIADVTQVAAALDHLHRHAPPIVHGDVKPANIIRTPEGHVVLVDFDIASALQVRPQGTRGYVAPEVAAGEKPTPSADVYGLAATIVTLLSGQSVIDPRETGAVASALRLGLSFDPGDRPLSATKLVERVRAASVTDLPTGVVAFLAIEIANRDVLQREDPEEFREATTRLRHLVTSVVETRGGRVVRGMQDGTIAVFSEASAAADAALRLQERLADPRSALGLAIQLRGALEVGEADAVEGEYIGPAVDRLRWLRSIAAPGATVTSQASADLIRDSLHDEAAIVPLGIAGTRDRPSGMTVCALTLVGHEHTAQLDSQVVMETTPEPATSAPAVDRFPRRHVIADALQHPATLTALTVAGVALIYVAVLAPDLGGTTLALVAFVLAAGVAIASFGWRYTIGYGEQQAVREKQALVRAEAEAAQQRAADFAERRNELQAGFARVRSDEGRRVLDGLAHEYEQVCLALARQQGGGLVSFVHILPALAEDTYVTGLSVLNQALGLLEATDDGKRQRLEHEIADITNSLADPASTDERERGRAERRRQAREDMLAAVREARHGARDALDEAERCEDTLHRARIELASITAGSAQVRAEAVIETLQENIRRVREVQDELRRLQSLSG